MSSVTERDIQTTQESEPDNDIDVIEETVDVVKVDYARKNRVWLHCRRSNGEKIEVNLTDHYPYFYAERDDDFDHDAIIDREHGHVSIFGDPLTKYTVKSPRDVRELRSFFSNVHQAKTPYPQRCIIDNGLMGRLKIRAAHHHGSTYVTRKDQIEPVENVSEDDILRSLHPVIYDIEVKHDESYSDPKDARNAIISISAYDVVKDKYLCWVYHPTDSVDSFDMNMERMGTYRIDARSFHDEREMLTDFGQWMQTRKPDVLVGYFSQSYDDPYLINRCERLGLYNPFGEKGATKAGNQRKYSNKHYPSSIPGVQLLDILAVHRRAMKSKGKKMKYNDLATVAEWLLDMEMEKERGRIMEWWHGDGGGLESLVEYNAKDVEATHLIDEEAGYSDLALGMMYITQVSDVMDSDRPAVYSSVFVNRVAKEMGRVPPDADPAKDPEIGEKVEGAVVQDTKKGLHDDVIALDVGCYDDKTEVLTRNGWKLFSDVEKGELVATVCRDTGEVEYQPAEEKHEYPYEGELYKISKPCGTEQVVTPDHRVVYSKRDSSVRSRMEWDDNLRVSRADDLPSTWISVPHFGKWKGENRDTLELGEYVVDAASFMKWLGVFLGDGHFKRDTPERMHLVVSQSREDTVDDVRSTFRALGVPFKEASYDREHIEHPEHVFTIYDQSFVRSVASMFGKDLPKSADKYIPRELLQLSSNLLDSLLKGLCLADGNVEDMRFTTTSRQLADDFQEAALKCGYHSNIGSQEYDREFRGSRCEGTLWSVSCNDGGRGGERRSVIHDVEESTEMVPYNGTVYCLTVDNGTLVTRRNDKVTVSGNSLYPTVVLAANLSPEMLADDTFDGPVATVDVEDSKGNVIRSHEYRLDTKGLLPRTVERYLDKKNEIKEKRNNATGKEKEKLQRLYFASKIITNAGSYGVLGQPFFNLYDQRVQESVTRLGRLVANTAVEAAEQAGWTVIAGDTDAIYCLANTDDPIEEGYKIAELAENAARQKLSDLGAEDPSILEIDFESLYKRLLMPPVKKKYAGLEVWADGKWLDEPKLKTTGFAMVRRDTPPISIQIQDDVLERLLVKGEPVDNILKEIDQLHVNALDGKLDPIQMARTPKIGKPFDEYKDPNNYIKRAAEYSNEHLQKDFGVDDRLFLVPVRKVEGDHPDTNWIAFEPDDEVPDWVTPDWEDMAGTAIFGCLETLLSSIGYETWVGGAGNRRLDQYDAVERSEQEGGGI